MVATVNNFIRADAVDGSGDHADTQANVVLGSELGIMCCSRRGKHCGDAKGHWSAQQTMLNPGPIRCFVVA